MSIIIDCNVAHKVNSKDEDGSPIFERLCAGQITLCVGGKLTSELMATKLAGLFPALRAAGRLYSVPKEQVELNEISISGRIVSDDPHVIAVALGSKCRLLFSNDQNLHKDFLDTNIIDNPKGRIYQYHRHHAHLLRSACAAR